MSSPPSRASTPSWEVWTGDHRGGAAGGRAERPCARRGRVGAGGARAVAAHAGLRRGHPPTHRGDDRPLPAVAVRAAPAAAPGAVGRGVRQPGRHPLLRRGAGADHGRGLGRRDVLHDVQAHAVRRAPGQRVHEHPVRGAGRRRHLRAAEGQAGRGSRGDGRRARRARVDHPGARGVPGRVRPGAGPAGELRVLRQPDRRVGRAAGRRAAARRAAAADPRCAADRPADRRAGAGRDLPGPADIGAGQLPRPRDPARRGAGHRPRLGGAGDARRAARPAGPAGGEMSEPITTPDPITPVLTRRWQSPRAWDIDTYEQLEGYVALRHALTGHPDQLIELVKASGLRGRGGAGFPTGMKWGFIPQGPTGPGAKPKYLVINADEGEPGTCKDIPTMMADPHALIEGCIITSYAIRANFCAIYIRGEALHPLRRVRHAVEQAYAKGYLGRDILGSGFDLDIVVHAGAGAYICGEETALLDSLEGRRGQPRLKPPFPATAGLYASPTVVNNVETIASVPFIVTGGSDWFRSMGTEKSPGPKIYSVSGHVERPGQIEAPLGTTLRQLLEMCGGMKDGIPLKFWTPGGSSTPLFTAEHLDVPLDFEGAAAAGSMLGTTAVQVFNETVSVPWAVMKWTEFYKHESCGKCTPCREGTYWLLQILERMVHHEGTPADVDTMLDICDNILGRSFCALGDGAVSPITSGIKYFRQEFLDLCTEQSPRNVTAAQDQLAELTGASA